MLNQKFWYKKNFYMYVGERKFYILAGQDKQTCFPVTDEGTIDNLYIKMEENQEKRN